MSRRRRVWVPLLLVLVPVAVAVGQEGSEPVQTITICHATLDPDPMYIQLELSLDQVEAHRLHSLDLIPAGPGGCNIPAGDPPPGAGDDEDDEQSSPPAQQQDDDDDDQEQGGSGTAGSGTRTPPPTFTPQRTAPSQPVAANTSDLPYTGFDPGPLILLGFAAMLAGLGVWYRWAGGTAELAARHAARPPYHVLGLEHEPRAPRPARPRAPEPPPPPDEMDEMRAVVARLEQLRAELREDGSR